MSVLFGIRVNDDLHQKICDKILDDYNKEKKQLPAQVRGCAHPESSAKFCGDCGKVTWKVNPNAVYLTQKDIEESCIAEFFDIYPFDWGWAGDEDGGSWFVGRSAGKLDRTKSLQQIETELLNELHKTFSYAAKKASFFEMNH